MNRRALVFMTGFILWSTGVYAQTATVCPSSISYINPIDGNAQCNPNESVTKSCDNQHNVSSRAWVACYDEVKACRRDVAIKNKVIADNNAEYKRLCPKANSLKTARKPPPAAPKIKSLGILNTPNENSGSAAMRATLEAAKRKANTSRSEKDEVQGMISDARRTKEEYRQQDELVAERKKLDADLAQQRQNKAKIQAEIDADENQRDAGSRGRSGCRPGEKWGRFQTTNSFMGWQSGCIPSSWPDR